MEHEHIDTPAALDVPASPRHARLVLMVDDDVSCAETVAAMVELADYAP